ncbi:hypothetical protein N7534_007903 [Penicillium rubens]|nr:hypothetical protein N7534_007903 [Penicillium rubens]
MKNHLNNAYCSQPRKNTKQSIDQLLREMTTLQKKILKFITTARLPFRTVEHPEFKELLQYTRLAKSELDIPSTRSLTRLLDNEVQEQQQSVLTKQKLSKYYGATDSESFGIVYAIATILCPSKKLRFFEGDNWKGKNEKGEDINWMEIYRDKLRKEFDQYQQRITRHREPSQAQVAQEGDEEELDLMMDLHATLQSEIDRPEDEITRYLAQGLTKGKPRVFWKEYEHEYLVLAAIARDNLATPASGAGVKRLFNCARDVCHYRRGQLKPETIRSLMLHLFASKFELQQTELEMIKEYLSSGEAAILDQTWKPTPSLNDIEPISENEEDGNHAEDGSDDSENDLGDNHIVEHATPTPVTTQGKQPRHKRPHSAVEPQDDGDNDLPLPEMPTEGSTQGRSGRRIRKKPKQPDGFEFDNL